jgi:hypothetical protein
MKLIAVIALMLACGCAHIVPKVGSDTQKQDQNGDGNIAIGQSSESPVKWVSITAIMGILAFTMRNVSFKWGGHIEADKRRGIFHDKGNA